MGRSTGVQVNAITKSGTNQFSGLFRGNFRNSALNASNPVLNQVVPIDNQQLSTTFGGPLVKDRLHFFGNYEYEREPKTSIFNTPYPAFNVQLTGTNNQKKGGVRRHPTVDEDARVMGKSPVVALRTVRARQPAAIWRRRAPTRSTTTNTSGSSRRF